MGIRVTKVMGYGLTDVKTRKYNIADGRINAKSPLLDWDADETLDDYMDWLKASHDPNDTSLRFNIDVWYLKDREEEGFSWREKTGATTPRDLVHHGIEYMEKNVLLVRPLFCKDWERYDDPIDYVEETHKYPDDGVVNWYREIPGGIFPYNGIFMNAKTGESVKNGIELWRYLTWPTFKTILTEDRLEAVSREMYGFNSAEDARENLVPTVPECVKDLVEWGKLFKDPNAWKQLRPLIYTYWS